MMNRPKNAPGNTDRRGRHLQPAILAALTAFGIGTAVLAKFPVLRLGFFARAAAIVAALVLGAPAVGSAPEGWTIGTRPLPLLVTAACSGADFWILVGAILAWHRARAGKALWRSAAFGLAVAPFLSIPANAVRIAALAGAHRWLIPQFPPAAASFLHLLVGVAVFLPTLILIHALPDSRNFFRAARAEPVTGR